MTSKRLCTALLALGLAAWPSGALAQSAGDDQYEDPFGDEAPQTATPEPSAPAPDPAQTPEPAPAAGTAAETPAPVAEEAAPAPVAVAVGGELPRTGADAGLLAAGGATLVLCGIALRLRLADGRRRA